MHGRTDDALLGTCTLFQIDGQCRRAEIGYGLARSAWGHGYATESATAALEDASRHPGITEIVSYTSADNLRSQGVMTRLGLQREPRRDFSAKYKHVGLWRGLVWVAFPT